MENASKAIIMAGAVLIAIIIISIGVFLWRDYSDFSIQSEEKRIEQQLDEFNTKFEKYNFTGANYITAQDVRTIVNYANEYNKKYRIEENEIIIQVRYRGMNLFAWDEERWTEFLNTSNESTVENKLLYECRITQPESKEIIRQIEIRDRR